MEPDPRMLQEVYRLARENNRLLTSMRRRAFWGGLIKFLIYLVFLSAPIWFYLTYLNGTVQQMLQAFGKVEGVSTAQPQSGGFEGVQDAWHQFEHSF